MPELFRVDVAGVSVWVRGEVSYRYLVQINRQLALARLALHKLAVSSGDIASKALEDMKNA